MCGIVGGVANQTITQILLDGLKKLQYRGYDSAGIAVIDQQSVLKRARLVGKVAQLEAVLINQPIIGNTGIAHTRWATHGIPSDINAHPFTSHNTFALVHNGIIENYISIRKRLITKGYHFESETDSEVIVHLIHDYYQQKKDFAEAVFSAVSELKGAYALAILCTDYPNQLIAVRQGSPLLIAKTNEGNFIASDPQALMSLTNEFANLEDNNLAVLTAESIKIFDAKKEVVPPVMQTIKLTDQESDRGIYRHYMQKEIMEQANAINSCLNDRVAGENILSGIFGVEAEKIFTQLKHIYLVACGTSYHACLTARYWLEQITNIPTTVEFASEFRYREIALPNASLFVALSQSGETADTLAALRLAKKMSYLATLAICNTANSTMIRESQLQFLTHAGIEIGVASTKAFLTQLISLLLLTLTIQKTKQIKTANTQQVIAMINKLPEYIEQVLALNDEYINWAKLFQHKKHIIYLGRGMLYPIALEGALKLKEVSYIHAEAFPMGELKHGSLALIDADMPVIILAPSNYLFEKTLNNIREVQARDGKLFIITDTPETMIEQGLTEAKFIKLPHINALLTPILYTVPLQLLAYHVAVLKGTDVDQPRNLAKSVTVE